MLSSGRALHVDVPLSNILINRRPKNFMADQIIPVISVDKQSNMFYRFRHGEWARYEAGLTLRAPRTQARNVHFSVSSDTYYAKNYALGTDLASEDIANSDQILRWAERHGSFLMDRMMMDYEWRIAQMAVNTSNVATVTLTTCGWFNASAPIFTQLLLYKEAFRQRTGMLPNTMILPEALRQYVTVNSQVSALLFGNRGGIPSMEQLAGMIGIEKVIVPATQTNTAGEGETMLGSWSYADVWGSTSIWMTYTDNAPLMETDTWIQAFRWTDPELGVPFALERFPYDPRAKKYDMAVGYYQDEKVVSPDLAHRIIVNSQ